MKIKIFLKDGESQEQAEETIAKALKTKHEFHDSERYYDPFLNEFHDYVEKRHADLVNHILAQIAEDIERVDS